MDHTLKCIFLGMPPWGITILVCIVLQLGIRTIFHLRMKEKLEKVMNDLKDHASAIDKTYTMGVVDGFSEECFPCK